VEIRGGGTQRARADTPEPDATTPASTPVRATRVPWTRERRRRVIVTLSLAAAILIGVNVYAASVIAGQHGGGTLLRPTGIPGNVSTSLANLMALSPVGGTAPGFTLTDQDGHTMSLASLHGKVVVLEFMDPHCTDICPIVSQEFVDANRYLGPLASKVVFAAVNVNKYVNSVQAMRQYSSAHRLGSVGSWHFFTGPVPALRKVWQAYHIQVEAPSPTADVAHTSAIYFIGAGGAERYLTSPMVNHTSDGTAYLPLSQINQWARGIALIARDMAS
jgi:cytochrome oxidase Cu insertion factor (SCO1/SenC/PrrC family)